MAAPPSPRDYQRDALHQPGVASDDTLPVHEEVESHDHSSIDQDTGRGAKLQKTDTQRSIAEEMSPFREFMFVSVMCLCQFTAQTGLGQCINIVHVIGDHYGLSNPGDLSWLIAGYSLTVGTFILVAGRFGDVFGYKRMLMIGFAWFTVWTLVAGLAHYSNHVLFVFARVFQGIGPSICLTNGLAILGSTYAPGKKKNMVFALFGATAPGGSITGSVFAGIFAGPAHAWWWVFYSFAIVLLILGIVGYFVVPDPPRKALVETASGRLPMHERLDLLGGGVGILALILFNFAWNQAGVVGWGSAYVCVTLVLGVALVPVFFWIEKRVAKAPLVPFHILTVDVAFVLACVACGWGSFGIWVYYLVQFLLTEHNLSPLLTAGWISPVAIVGASAAVLTGLLLSRVRAAWVMTMAMTAFLVGNILIATAPPDQIYWAQVFVCTLVIPFGMDMSFPASTVIVSNALPKEKQGVGASLVNTVVNYSISLALGFAGTVEGNVANGNQLRGYRGALYMGIGLAGLGLAISIVFLVRSYVKNEVFKGGDAPEKLQEDPADQRVDEKKDLES